SNVPPMSCLKSSARAATSRCPVEEIGRNSVTPSTIPNTPTFHHSGSVGTVSTSPTTRSSAAAPPRMSGRRVGPPAVVRDCEERVARDTGLDMLLSMYAVFCSATGPTHLESPRDATANGTRIGVFAPPVNHPPRLHREDGTGASGAAAQQ